MQMHYLKNNALALPILPESISNCPDLHNHIRALQAFLFFIYLFIKAA